MITGLSTLTDVAFDVCTALAEVGTRAILTGGSAATYHAPDAIESDDLDFVITLYGDGTSAAAVATLGYRLEASMYRHPLSRFTLDFPAGPLAIGDDFISRWATARGGDGLLHVLTPTDSCRDRLASFFLWNAFTGPSTAVAVFRPQPAVAHSGGRARVGMGSTPGK